MCVKEDISCAPRKELCSGLWMASILIHFESFGIKTLEILYFNHALKSSLQFPANDNKLPYSTCIYHNSIEGCLFTYNFPFWKIFNRISKRVCNGNPCGANYFIKDDSIYMFPFCERLFLLPYLFVQFCFCLSSFELVSSKSFTTSILYNYI